jgi:hypothetical protein
MKSNLSVLLNFKESDINWFQCHEVACKGLIKSACDLWNTGNISIVNIAKNLNVCRNTAKTYIKQGAEIGLCTYNPNEEVVKSNAFMQKKKCKKIICITTNKVFNSIKEAACYYKLNNNSISRCCLLQYKYSGKNPVTGEPLVWRYYEDYIKDQNNKAS